MIPALLHRGLQILDAGLGADFLFDLSWKASAILLGIALLQSRFGRLAKLSADRVHRTVLLGCGLMLILPLWALALPQWELASLSWLPAPHLDPATTRVVELDERVLTLSSETGRFSASRLGTQQEAWQFDAIQEPRSSNTASPTWSAWLAGLWLIGAALFGLRLWMRWWRLQRLSRAAEPCTHLAWLEERHHWVERLALSRVPGLRVHAEVSAPMTFGWRRPVVLLPIQALSWPQSRRRVTLLHELAHVRRRDYLGNLLIEATCCLYWFHPLAWWTARQARMQRELACDEFVLHTGACATTYATELVHLARVLTDRPRAARPAIAILRQHEIEARIRAILDRGHRHRDSVRHPSIRLGIGLALFATTLIGTRLIAQPTNTTEQLLSVLEDSEQEARVATLHALGVLADRKAFYRVLPYWGDARAEVRRATLWCLARIGCEPAFLATALALSDADASVRQQAATALGSFPSSWLRRDLAQLFRDQHPISIRDLTQVTGADFRGTAARALERATQDVDPRVRSAARASLSFP